MFACSFPNPKHELLTFDWQTWEINKPIVNAGFGSSGKVVEMGIAAENRQFVLAGEGFDPVDLLKILVHDLHEDLRLW